MHCRSHRLILQDRTYPSLGDVVQPREDGCNRILSEDLLNFLPTLSIDSQTRDTLSSNLLAAVVLTYLSVGFGDQQQGRLSNDFARDHPVKYLSPATSTAIIRCPRASFRLVWSALTYMSHVPAVTEPGTNPTGHKRPNGGRERPCVFRVLRVSGTMRKAEEEAIRRARREIVRVRGLEEKSVLGDLIVGAERGTDVLPVMTVMDEEEDERMYDDGDDD
ncbi:Uncharacterized protein PECM_002257 [Penicillium ucsense]|uniref:Uncharacterized protein n=1 Tax=Penicillium ucsense TaxID=2839758 RepID=A0A8J8W6D2_9EURO|nr:Uncharacterized protein PECM_002257 [Penicillium ucsense]